MAEALERIVREFAKALAVVDSEKPQGASRTRTYQPGVGPLTEAEAVSRAYRYLMEKVDPKLYSRASSRTYPAGRQKCDLVIQDEWAIEFKLIRPFGDNGKPAEHWSENILYPYRGNISSIGDCIKLATSGFPERKAIVVFGYEHVPPQIKLETGIQAFELIARSVVRIHLSARCEVTFGPLIHPIHQQGSVFGWEVLGLTGNLS